MKRRASRTGREAHDQLSFFDPSGDLPNLREEARRISVAAEHQAFLEQGKRRAQAAIAELESEIELARRDAAQIAGSSGDHFQITLTDDGRAVVVTDRREAGEALRARMLAISADEDVVAFGQFAGLAMDASLTRLNFRIGAEHRIGEGTPKEKVAANIAAIRILKTLTEDDRPATQEERAALVRYVGWGAFAQAMFDKNPNTANAHSWRKERQELADLITSDEWVAARASTLNAHYTSEAVIRGMWRALDHLGFAGGRVLEPSAGIGHFIGLTPDHLHDEIAWTGVEIDPITGDIAKALYPGADIRVEGFETAARPDGFFDLAISNVPFGDYSIRDTRYRPMSIHDYFFVRSLDKVRPGGLVAFITSRYSLDKETDLARREITRRADFLGAIRWPGGKDGAFARNAGTEVTTDIIFLRRRAENPPAINESWLSLSDLDTPDGPIRINSYFVQNPQMLLGEMRLRGSMRGAAEPVLVGPVEKIEETIAHAARHMAANAFIPRGSLVRHETESLAAVDTDTDGIREGAFYLKEGQVYRRLHGVGEPQNLSRIDADKVQALIEMRDVLNELLARQAGGDPADPGPLRDRLNRFAGRSVADLETLNAQAGEWCRGIAADRRCPGQDTISVREAFAEEAPRLLPLPDNPYPLIEQVAVKAGKTPYIRFDLNDYSIPHTHVRRSLTVLADACEVRIADAGQILAHHPRSYDKGQQVEDETHIRALIEQKRAGRRHRAADHLFQAAPASETLFIRAAERGGNLRAIAAGLTRLLQRYGAAELQAAILEALDRDVPHPNAVRFALERRRQDRHQPPPIAVDLPPHVRARDIPASCSSRVGSASG